MPGQAGGGVAAVWDVAARAAGLHAAAARDEIRAVLQQMPCCDGAYFAWAGDDEWGGSTIAPMQKGTSAASSRRLPGTPR
eukprot:15311191-Alexandrium_andersonii.AAC.1